MCFFVSSYNPTLCLTSCVPNINLKTDRAKEEGIDAVSAFLVHFIYGFDFKRSWQDVWESLHYSSLTCTGPLAVNSRTKGYVET